MYKIIKSKSNTDNLCKYCQNDFATCKPVHIAFGIGIGNDNVIECSEYVQLSFHNNYPIESDTKNIENDK